MARALGSSRAAIGFAAALVVVGCTALTDFDGYSSGDMDGSMARDGGARDGEVPDGGGDGCDPACGERGECVEGVCRCGGGDACAAAQTCCDGACVDTSADVEHCGGCGDPCPSGERATRTCAAGACGFDCDSGFADCDEGVPGCEADLGDPATCGGCETACAVDELCESAGGGFDCVDTCAEGLTECGGSCVDTSANVSHCGGCDDACPSLDNATAGCASSACTYECAGMFADCDEDLDEGASSDGCEVVPPRYYRDTDGDGYGVAAMTMRFCAGTAPSGWAEMSGDCRPMDGDAYPMASERCNAVNDDCDAETDEGFMLGDACRCEDGAERGALICDTDTTTTCDYPAEVCNGLDDDCDGAPDDLGAGSCVQGTTDDTCTISGGCVGTRVCRDDCTWGACEPPPDVCNLMDDDCDGFPDDELGLSSPNTIGTAGAAVVDVAAAWRADVASGAVMWLTENGSGTFDLYFTTFDGSGRRLLATPPRVRNFSTRPGQLELGWDGGAWVVFLIPEPGSSNIAFARVNGSGSIVDAFDDWPPPPASAAFSRFVALATGVGCVGVVYPVPGAGRIYGAIVQSGTVVSNDVLLSVSGSTANTEVAVASLGSCDFLALIPNDLGTTTVTRFSASGVGTGSRIGLGHANHVPQDAAWDPSVPGRLLYVLRGRTSGGVNEPLSVTVASGGFPGVVRTLSGGLALPLHAAATDDGSSLAATRADARPTRLRTDVDLPYPAAGTPALPAPLDVVGMPGATNRYVAFFFEGTELVSRTLGCP
ncbi:MAG TPA: hypothetical protein RMH99_21370 [Sandaracinaceae bacterium LLY-WYZ-13_1]|nr:hypothetical protein [Sandaracinaceae bacterium LLY-WYZ-13_1]